MGESLAEKRAFDLPRTVIALGITSLLTDVGTEMIFPLLPLFLTDVLGAGPAFLGLMEGAADGVASFLKLGSGYLADRRSRRTPMVLFGYGLASLVRPLVALAVAPWQVLAIRLADRLGKGIRTSPRDALLADSVEPRSAGRAFGFHRAMDHAGAVLGPAVAALLLTGHVPLRWVFALALIPGLLAMMTLIAAVKEPGKAADSGSDSPGRPKPSKLRTPRPLFSFLGILLLFSLGNSSDAFLLLRARELGLAAAALPVLWSLLHVSKMVSSLGGGVLSDRLGRERLIIAGWVIYAAVYFGLAWAKGPLAVWGLFVVYGIYHGLTEPAEKALVNDLARQGGRGRAFGYYNFVIGISAVPAGLLTGWLWQKYSPATALTAGAALAAVSCLLLIVWRAFRSHDLQTE